MLRHHHLLVLVAALAAPPPPEPSVGVCWTRNRVDVREPKARRGEANRSADALELRNLVLSAGSVRRRHNVSSCLFTDLAAPLLAAAVGELLAAPGAGELRGLRLFDEVLPDGEAAFLAALEKRGDGKLAAWARDAGTLVNSRLGRIYNLARAPFDVTLFLDDDTYACAGGLELSLRRLAGLRKGPALRAHPFSSPSTGISPAKLRDVAACAWRGAKDAAKRAGETVDGASLHAACADAHAKASLWCPGAQGGAILADRRTKGLGKFVDGWLETYVNVGPASRRASFPVRRPFRRSTASTPTATRGRRAAATATSARTSTRSKGSSRPRTSARRSARPTSSTSGICR